MVVDTELQLLQKLLLKGPSLHQGHSVAKYQEIAFLEQRM